MVCFGIGDITVPSSGTVAEFPITRSSSGEVFSFQYTTVAGTSAPPDYTAASGIFTFPSTGTLGDISILLDSGRTVSSPSEQFYLVGTPLTSGEALSVQIIGSQVTVTDFSYTGGNGTSDGIYLVWRDPAEVGGEPNEKLTSVGQVINPDLWTAHDLTDYRLIAYSNASHTARASVTGISTWQVSGGVTNANKLFRYEKVFTAHTRVTTTSATSYSGSAISIADTGVEVSVSYPDAPSPDPAVVTDSSQGEERYGYGVLDASGNCTFSVTGSLSISSKQSSGQSETWSTLYHQTKDPVVFGTSTSALLPSEYRSAKNNGGSQPVYSSMSVIDGSILRDNDGSTYIQALNTETGDYPHIYVGLNYGSNVTIGSYSVSGEIWDSNEPGGPFWATADAIWSSSGASAPWEPVYSLPVTGQYFMVELHGTDIVSVGTIDMRFLELSVSASGSSSSTTCDPATGTATLLAVEVEPPPGTGTYQISIDDSSFTRKVETPKIVTFVVSMSPSASFTTLVDFSASPSPYANFRIVSGSTGTVSIVDSIGYITVEVQPIFPCRKYLEGTITVSLSNPRQA